MKVSVIVPNYNHSKYLRQRIDSILNQTCRDFELLILDDFSNDDSRSIIDDYVSRFPGIMHFYNRSNSGSPFIQWDQGVKRAKGEFIWISESDDFAEPVFLERSLAVLESNRNIGLVYCDSKVTDEQNKTEYLISGYKVKLYGERWAGNYFNEGLNELSEYLCLSNTINNVSGVLFRKSKYIEAGLADYSMNYCGDWFLYVRMMMISDVAYLADPLNTIRIHSGSTCHQYFVKSTYFLEVLRVYRFTAKSINLSLKKKYAMARILLGIIARKILNGNIPEFRSALKIIFTSP